MTFSALRRALAIQGVLLTLPVVLFVVATVDSYVNPPRCYGWCLNLTPLYYGFASLPFIPPIAVIAVTAWRWRGQSMWPAAVVVVTDVAIVILAVGVIQAYASQWPSPVPAVGLLPLVVILPALATALLTIHLLRPIPVRPAVAVCAAGCVAFGGLIAFNVIGPFAQEIPGQLSLPFAASVVYRAHDLGCFDTDQGWTQQHNCYDTALVVYRGSGDVAADELTIDKAVEDRTRLSPTQGKVEPLPVDRPFGKSYLGTMDYRQSGGCLLIIDETSPVPTQVTYGHCGKAGDYAEIRAHWPGNGAYAIGIVYTYLRPG